MRVGILTSTDIRHRYFVNAVRAACKVVAVGYQDTGYNPANTVRPETQEGRGRLVDRHTEEVVRHHFAERARQEEQFFGHDAEPVEAGPQCRVIHVDVESLNTFRTAATLDGAGVALLLVFGTSLIRPPLLDIFAGRMINLHLGLSPYYRGTATNFYPLVNDEPEYVGATIHHIDAGIDSGDIIHQVRPDIVADDMPHTVGCKAIAAGIAKMIETVREFEVGRMCSVPQWPVKNAHLYRRRDYRPEDVVRLYELIENGLFPKYVARKAEVAPRVRLVP